MRLTLLQCNPADHIRYINKGMRGAYFPESVRKTTDGRRIDTRYDRGAPPPIRHPHRCGRYSVSITES